jgi:signal transduction histidine kinase
MDIVHTVCDSFVIDVKKKNLALVTEGTSSLVQADHDKLCQVMVNLLSNAVKYTGEHGTIRISVKDRDTSGMLIVEDDGIGIPQQDLSLIFERFYRTDKSRNRESGGAGIGLAIVKSIVEAHGGIVKAESGAEQAAVYCNLAEIIVN